ncbi:VOC family protein [Lysinibacillus telephonicus]|uniref:VOC family protein n=1 Tax=Lysinibacillus telephonicus TaxID=1714840 RepID=UPI0031FDD0E9
MYLLDHIVHFVDKPEQLVEETKKIGLYTVNGGKHGMWGTYNSLSYFGLSYIEFIGIFDDELFEKSALEPFTLHESYKKRNRKNGFTRIALRTTSIEADAQKLKDAGLVVHGPETFSRTRPDGSVLKWKLLHFGNENQEIEFPFLIQWEGSDSDRYDELVKKETIGEHPLGNLKIEEVSYVVENLKSVKEWAELFNFDLDINETYIKLKAPNCVIGFYKNTNDKNSNINQITEVIISGAKEQKEIELEGASYKFKR